MGETLRRYNQDDRFGIGARLVHHRRFALPRFEHRRETCGSCRRSFRLVHGTDTNRQGDERA